VAFSLPIFAHAFHIPNWSMQIPSAVVGDYGGIPAGWVLTGTPGNMIFAGRRDLDFQAGRFRVQSIRTPAHSGTYSVILRSPLATAPIPTANPTAFPFYFAASRAQSGDYSETTYGVAWYSTDGTYISTTPIASWLPETPGSLDVYSGNLTPPSGAWTLAISVVATGYTTTEVQEWLFAGAILGFGWTELARHPWFPGTVATPVGFTRRATTLAGRKLRTDQCRDAMRRTHAFQLGAVSLADRNALENLWQANRGLASNASSYRLFNCPPVLVLPGNPGMPSIFVGDCEDDRFPLAVDGWASDSQQLYSGTLNLAEVL